MKANPESEQLVCGVEYKFVDKDKGIVEGYASVFDNEDLNREVVEHGAFKKTIGERVNRGVVPFLDSHRWDIAHTLGSIVAASEDSKGLQYRAHLSNAPSVQDARIKMLEGHIKLNSIGHKVVLDKFVRDAETKAVRRHLQEVKLLEISALPVAANDRAGIVNVKSVMPFEDLPIAPREREWNETAAFKHVIEWAGGTFGDDGRIEESKINWTRFRRAFVGCDPENPDRVTSYKMPIADVIDGDLVAVPRAIFAAAKTAEGPGEHDEDDEAAIRHLDRYLDKMGVAQWQRKDAAGHGGFLVSDKDGDHLPTMKDGKLDHGLMGAAWAALHGGYRGNIYDGPNKADAIAKLKKLYEREGMKTPDEKKSVEALIVEARELGVYDVSQIRDAAFGLLGILTPAERKQILDEFSAGPGNTTHGSERDSQLARLRRLRLLNSTIA